VEVSIVSCDQRTCNVSLLSVGRVIYQGPEVLVPDPQWMTTPRVPASIPLIKIMSWDGRSPDIKHVLTTAFDAEGYLDCVQNLTAHGIKPESYINRLDKVCKHSTPSQRAQGYNDFEIDCRQRSG
jgi:hypothetical protein